MIPVARPLVPARRADARMLVVELALLVGALVYLPLTQGAVLYTGEEQTLAAVDALPHRWWSAAWDAFSRVERPAHSAPSYQPAATISLVLDRVRGEPAERDRTSADRLFPATDAILAAPRGSEWLSTARVTQLFLHAISALLVASVFRGLGAGPFEAMIAGALFLLHPAQVDAVASAANRATVLATAASVACIDGHLRWVASRRLRPRVISVAMFIVALLSSPHAAMVPLLLLLLDDWPLRRLSRSAVREKLPLVVPACVAAGAWVTGPLRAVAYDVPPMRAISYGFVSQLRDLAWPIGLHPLPDWPTEFALWPTAVLLGLLGAAGLAWREERARPIAVWIGIIFVLLLPAALEYRFTDGPPAASSLGLALAFLSLPLMMRPRGAASVALPRGQLVAAWAAVALAGAGLGLHAYRLASRRTSTENLLTTAIASNSNAVRARAALAEYRLRLGQVSTATPIAEEALRLAPLRAESNFAAGAVRLASGDAANAVAPLGFAAARRPDWAKAAAKLGSALLRLDRHAEAVEPLERAVRLAPDVAAIRFALGEAYLAVGRPASARGELQIALNLGRNEPDTHLRLAVAWAEIDVPDLARRHLAAAVAADHDMARLAGREPALRRLADRPDFAKLIAPIDDASAPGR